MHFEFYYKPYIGLILKKLVTFKPTWTHWLFTYFVVLYTRLDRFHFLFFCSVLSSACLFGIVQSRSLSYGILFIGLFGLCMGFSTAIAIKWCLGLNSLARSSQNLQTNLLQVLSLIGLLVFFTLFTNAISGSHFEAFNATRSDLIRSQTQLMTTTPKQHLKKPSISDGSFLAQDHVTKPTFIANSSQVSRMKRQMLLTETTTIEMDTTSIFMAGNLSSTEKVHLKKPEAADGSFLEQSRITKPQTGLASKSPEFTYDNEYINKSAELRQCLAKLNRDCNFKLQHCQIYSQTDQTMASLNQTGKSRYGMFFFTVYVTFLWL